jgi:hypothetical protein
VDNTTFVDTNTCWGSELTTDADAMLSESPRGTCVLLGAAGCGGELAGGSGVSGSRETDAVDLDAF